MHTPVGRRAFLAGAGTAALAAGCRSRTERGPIVLRLSHSMAAGTTALHVLGDTFRELAEKATDGAVTVRVFPSGTLGQGYRALFAGNIFSSGVLLQLRADGAFRTNIGAMNTENTVVHVTWKLYDKNNAEVSEATTTVQPYAVIPPTSVASLFSVGNAALSDAYVTFTSDEPLAVYASVIDNATTDPTFFSAMSPSGF